MKIAIIGYGRMGKMVESIARSRGHEIVSIIDVENVADFGSEAFASADVAIEFTHPESAFANVERCWERGVKVVSGTTGWLDAHISAVEKACSEGGKTLFWSSNFSVGVALFSAVNIYLAKIMNGFEQYDVHISETHHIHKKDHPSGTAITLAEQILSHLARKKQWREGAEHESKSAELRIESVRKGEVVGLHEVVYSSEEDSITIAHDAHSRRGFALGAVLAAEYAAEHEGLLAMSDMIKI